MVRTNWKAAVAAVCVLGCGAGIAISQQDDFNKDEAPGFIRKDFAPTEPPKQNRPADSAAAAADSFSASPSLPGQAKASNPINAPGTIFLDSREPSPRSLPPASSGSPVFFNQEPDLVDSEDPFSEPQPRVQVSPEYVQAIRVLQNSEVNEEQRTAARNTIRKVLGEQFDSDMTSRQQQLDDLEKKLVRLKSQFQKRQESRDKLVELQIQLLENEATGLGFPASWSRVNGRSMPGAWFAPNSMPAAPFQTN